MDRARRGRRPRRARRDLVAGQHHVPERRRREGAPALGGHRRHGGSTSHAELLQNRKRFLAGTYATRIKFADAPATGADGAHINQTFFTIGPAQRFDYDPLYSELDFSEYLPNGGWGEQGPINYQTSWNGYRLEPWDARNAHSEQRRSFDGWHDLVSRSRPGT